MIEDIHEEQHPDVVDVQDHKHRQFVVALARGLEVLQAFKRGDDFLTNAEIARRTHLPKPTISRLTYTLTTLGYLSPADDTGGYRLDPHILSLGYPVLAKIGVRQMARPLAQRLADYSRGTVSIGVQDGLSMILVERSQDRTVVTMPLEIGSRIPIATTSMGRAYLAALPDSRRTLLMEEIRRSGPEDWWPAIQNGIDREIEQFQEKGYCVSVGDWDPDINGVSAPLILQDGAILVFNCGGPSNRVPKEKLGELGERLKQIVQAVAAAHSAGPQLTL